MIPPYDPDSGWDTIIVAGVPSPGICRLSGHNREIGWDIKNADGQNGASTTRKGQPIGKFSAEFYLVADEEFAAWTPFQALLESSITGDQPQALDIVHPDLLRNHFTAVVLANVGEMVADEQGGSRVKVDLIEHRPPKPKRAAGTGSKSTKTSTGAADGGPTAGDYKIAAAEAELAGLLAQGDAL